MANKIFLASADDQMLEYWYLWFSLTLKAPFSFETICDINSGNAKCVKNAMKRKILRRILEENAL